MCILTCKITSDEWSWQRKLKHTISAGQTSSLEIQYLFNHWRNPTTHSMEPNTGRFIMFSVITNIHNKKTKGPTLMELFTATGKLKVFFFWQLEMFDVCTTGDTSIRYSSSCHTRVNMGASIFFTAAMIRAFRSARSSGRVLWVLCTKCTSHSKHRLTRLIFQHTKRLLPPERPLSHYIHSHGLAAEMSRVTPSICRGFVNTCPTVFL